MICGECGPAGSSSPFRAPPGGRAFQPSGPLVFQHGHLGLHVRGDGEGVGVVAVDILRGLEVVDELLHALQPVGAAVFVPVVHGDDDLGHDLVRGPLGLLGGQSRGGAGADHAHVRPEEPGDLPAVQLGAQIAHMHQLDAVRLQNVDLGSPASCPF